MKTIAGLFIALLFTSCVSFHSGAISSGPLLSVNDKYVDMATGYAKTTYFFGVGGLSKTALVYDAKTDMMNNGHLKKGEYYSNFTVDFKKTIVLFVYATNEVFVSADILTKDSILPTNVNKENSSSFLNYIKTKQDSFYVGENVVYYYYPDEEPNKFRPYEIVSFIDKNKVTLKSFNKEERDITVSINQLVYSMDKPRNGFAYGDSVTYRSKKLFSKKIAGGKVVATSANYAMVLEGKRTFEIKYDKLTKVNGAK